jgi:uncharacterized protein (TIGR02246 family)
MDDDQQAIRKLVEAWMAASKAGDVAAVLDLMTDDAVFMVPGRQPFGREAFAAMSQASGASNIDGTGEIVELQVLGDWAFTRARISMTITPTDGEPVRRSGFALTLFQKQGSGRWLLARDANLLTTQG